MNTEAGCLVHGVVAIMRQKVLLQKVPDVQGMVTTSTSKGVSFCEKDGGCLNKLSPVHERLFSV